LSDPPGASPRRGRTFRKSRVRVGILVVLSALLLWFIGDLAYISVDAEYDDAQNADVILVLGCNVGSPREPSPCMQARAAHAAGLYLAGRAGYVMASGGPSHPEITEAAALARLLVRDGVPRDRIVLEDRSLNTIQNIRYSSALMQEHGWKSAILVTESFHIRRATLIAHDFGLEVWPSPAVRSANWDAPLARAYNLARDAVSLMLYQAKMLVGIRE
jgi:uncharacterized SAM-binding protein YcdF (DUF218 family)